MECLKLAYYEKNLFTLRPLRKIEESEKTCVSLLYFGARYYNSDISVWLSVDPLSDKYPSLSPYNYCFNNPINLVDKWGLEGEDSDDPPKGTNPELNENSSLNSDNSYYGNGDYVHNQSSNENNSASSNNSANANKSSYRPSPKFHRWFGLANDLRRDISHAIGLNSNAHTFEWNFGYKVFFIPYTKVSWTIVAEGDQTTGPINFSSNKYHEIYIHLEEDSWGTPISGLINRMPYNLYSFIDINGNAIAPDNKPFSDYIYKKGKPSGSCFFNPPRGTIYNWYAKERREKRKYIKTPLLWIQ